MGSKKCKSCLEVKELSEFFKDKSKEDGYNYRCKNCVKAKNFIGKKEKKLTGEIKLCKCCLKNKDLAYFTYKNYEKRYLNRCSQCKEENKTIKGNKKKNGKIRCSKCYILKHPLEYYKNRTTSTGVASRCKKCTREDSKIFYWENKELFRQKVLERKEEDVIKYRKNARKREAERIKNEPTYKIKRRIRSLVKDSFKYCKHNKNSKTQDILECPMEEFKQHIESQFLDWMNWNNYGTCETNEYRCSWHLDHIIPVSYAKNEKEVIILNHWTNFQPKCSKKNMEKGDALYPCTNLENEEINKIIKREHEKQQN